MLSAQLARRAMPVLGGSAPMVAALGVAAGRMAAATSTGGVSATIARSAVLLHAADRRRAYATPAKALPKGFRITPRPEWDQDKEGTAEKLGKYFMLLEMARGMYVLLEQFFRPP